MSRKYPEPQIRKDINFYDDVLDNPIYAVHRGSLHEEDNDPEVIKETPKKKKIRHTTDHYFTDTQGNTTYIGSESFDTYAHKYLCIGGPLDHQWEIEDIAKNYSFWFGFHETAKKKMHILLWNGML